MVLARSDLRTWLRNPLTVFPLVLIAGVMSGGCALIADIQNPNPKRVPENIDQPIDGNDGDEPSATPSSTLPQDTSLPAPPPSDCGADTNTSADNCGFCGHRCGAGIACDKGLCAASVVASSPSSIRSFVANGDDLYFVDQDVPKACGSLSVSALPATCKEIVPGAEVGQRFAIDLEGENEHGGGNGQKGPPIGQNSPLVAKAIAVTTDRVFIADDAYHAIINCPRTGPCNHDTLGLVDASSLTSIVGGSTQPFGRTLSVSATDIGFTQGDSVIGAAPIPAAKKVVGMSSVVKRDENDTKTTTRIAFPTDLFWLSSEGLHHANDVESFAGSPSEKWFGGVNGTGLIDFSIDSKSVYITSPVGIFRVSRTDRVATIAAAGAFARAAAVEGALYATRVTATGTMLVEVRGAGKVLDLAFVDGEIDGISVTANYIYFTAHAASTTSVDIRRVAR